MSRIILILEDEPAILALLERALESHGFQPAPCSGGDIPEVALAAAVIDMSAAGDTAHELRRRHPRLPIIFISGSPAAGNMPVPEPVHFLQKPFLPQQLIDLLVLLTAPV